MKIINTDKAAVSASPRGVNVKHLLSNDSVAVSNIFLQPGEAVPSHTTPVDVFFYIIEGKGRVQIGQEIAEVKEKDLIESPAGIPHALFADDYFFSVMVVKTPNPKTQKLS